MKNREIDKSKLVLYRKTSEKLHDQPLETKEIGYYQDSWNRFKKNRASLIAFIIILVLLFFIAFGPLMKKYDLPQRSSAEAQRLDNIVPKIPVLEKIGIFDGTKTVTRGKRFLIALAKSDFGEGVIISGMPDELLDDDPTNDSEWDNITELTVKVDYYRYKNFIVSYMPTNYFQIIDENDRNGTNNDPLAGVTRTINQARYDQYVEKNYIIDVLSVTPITNTQTSEVTYEYRVRYDQFKVALDQTPDDTYFWWGTNVRGEDLFLEVWKGARISLIMAVAVLIINYTIGLTVGAIVGYYGGILDLLFDRLVEIITSIPFLSVLMLLTLRFGTKMWVIVLAFTATGWIGPYSTGRLQFYRFKNREYVLAARTLGASDRRIMFKHIFPNTLGLIITGMALAIPSFVFTESTYAFLDIIKYENATSIGMLIQEGQAVMHQNPHLILFPSLYIATLMISFNLFGNGLRDAFNPSLRGVE